MAPLSLGIGGTLSPPLEGFLRSVRSAERKGLAAIWWPDHLMGWLPESIWTPDISGVAARVPNPHISMDPIACIATAAQLTETVMLGTSVTESIRRHPAMLANEFLTLHHLSRGRTVLGIGAGEAENIVPYGMDYRYQVSRLEEALEVIRLLWEADGPVSYSGRFYNLDRAVLGIGPFEGAYPEIWVGGHGPRVCGITGRHADGWIPSKMHLDVYEERLAEVRSAAVAAGRDPAAITPALFGYLAIGDDHDRCHVWLNHPLVKGFCLALPDWAYQSVGHTHPMGKGFNGLTSYVPAGMGRQEALDLIAAVPFDVVHEHVFHGTPEEIVVELGHFEAAGTRHVALQNIGFFADVDFTAASFALLGELVERLGSTGDGHANAGEGTGRPAPW